MTELPNMTLPFRLRESNLLFKLHRLTPVWASRLSISPTTRLMPPGTSSGSGRKPRRLMQLFQLAGEKSEEDYRNTNLQISGNAGIFLPEPHWDISAHFEPVTRR
jgi:hypothetical protein